MEINKTNTFENQPTTEVIDTVPGFEPQRTLEAGEVTPLLITEGMVPSVESNPQELVETDQPSQTELVEHVPEGMRANLTELKMGHRVVHAAIEQIRTEEGTGSVDVHSTANPAAGRFGNGKAPVENPGPTSFIQAHANGSLDNSQYSIPGRR